MTIKGLKKGWENKMEKKQVLEAIGDIIKDSFPFYTSYKVKIKEKSYRIMVLYYYMGKLTSFVQDVPKRDLTTEKDFDGFKICLTNVKKDLVSYPNNKTQQKFLRKERGIKC